MRHRYPLLLVLGLLPLAARAQQPFARFGVQVKVLTLSNGRYPEFYPNDSLRRIGSVVYNTRLKRIAYLLPADSLVGRAPSEVTSRWLAVDPLAEKYAFITPYAYTLNNPIKYVDPDGRDPRIARTVDNNGNTTITVTTNIVLVNQSSQAVAQMRGLNAEAGKYLPTSSFSSGNSTTTTVKFISNVLAVGSEKEYKQLDKELGGATVRAEFNGKITGDQANYDGAVNFGPQLSARSLFHEIGHDFGFADKYLEDSQGYAAVLKDYVNTLMGTSSPLSNKEAQALAAGAVADGVYQPVNREKDEVPVGSSVEVYKQAAGGGLEPNTTRTVARPGDGMLNQTRKMSN